MPLIRFINHEHNRLLLDTERKDAVDWLKKVTSIRMHFVRKKDRVRSDFNDLLLRYCLRAVHGLAKKKQFDPKAQLREIDP